ncbi:MAG: CHAT domain-containing tetratricopeptide repeat protein, partial [Crocosphaera sp.]
SQNNLGNAYSDRIRGERADNLEKAIAAYNLSLEVYTREAFPEAWARTQNNLGNAYGSRIRGERADNLEEAIAAYEKSLEVRTRTAFPEDWATTQNNLGNAYGRRIRGERADNLEEAIAAYEKSLEVRTPTAFPIDCLQTGRNLGNMAKGEEDWETAIKGYGVAIEAVEQSREWAFLQRNKKEIQTEAIDVYDQHIAACVKLGRLEEAFGTVESNKSRYLIELLAAINIIIPNDATEEQRNIYNEYKTLRRHIDTLGLQAEDLMKSEIRSQKSEVVQVVDQTISITPEKQSSFNKQQLISDRRRLNELLEDIQTFDPDFTVTQRIERVKLSEIQGILDPETVIWEWYITPPQQESKESCFYTLIITHNHIDVVKSNSDELDKLIDWKDDYLDRYYWTLSLFWKLAFLRGAEILGLSLLCARVVQKWYNWYNFSEILESLWERLLIPQLLEKTPDECEKLVLIPHQYLHIFPIHAVSGKINNQPLTLQQRFQQGIQYIPSCQLLKRLHKKFRLRQKKANNTPFFGIQNPTLDLKYSDLEVESIKKKFVPNAFILRREQATKTELNKSDTIKELSQSYYVHFACHGAYNFQSPLDSALCLAGSKKTPQPSDRQREQETSRNTITLRDGESYDIEKSLRLQDIFETINLPQCYLVILSACETGLTTFEPNIDEYLGLGSGFLYAGSLHVINTLWRINDFVTAIFMIYCYQEIVDNNQPIPIALQNSQKWIREAKASKIMEWFEDMEKKEIIDKNTKYDMITVLQRDYYEQDPPFQNPTYWAAFCSLGLIH